MKIQKFWDNLLTLLAILFLGTYSYPAFYANPSNVFRTISTLTQFVCWFAFAADLLVGAIKSQNRLNYLKSHMLEVIAVTLPFLRVFRVIRLISLGSLVIDRIAVGKSVTIVVKVAVTSFFLAYVAAVQVTLLERPTPGSNIISFSDGLWWALTTVTTVGYGDRYPTTTEGRVIAFGLMIVGISLLGVITATVAAWFIQLDHTSVESE